MTNEPKRPVAEATSVAPPEVSRHQASLRLRIGGWNVMVFTVTLAAFTMAGIVAERKNLEAVEAAHAGALLAHLAEMPEFKADRAAAEAALLLLSHSLHAAGSTVELVPAGTAAGGPSLTTQPLMLRDGRFELHLRSNPTWLRDVARRSMLLHLFHGVLALGALLLGTEWILRQRLVAPLARISHAVELINRGWGWTARLPTTDVELDRLARAIAGLGPSLSSQVEQWVEAERRAAAGMALQQMRLRLREPRGHAYALLGDLQARGLVAPEGTRRVRLLREELDRIAAVIDDEEQRRCQPLPDAGGAAPAP